MNAGRVSPSLALAAYAEAWISGAKVVVFGDASSPLAERLVERGARHVQVYDVDAARAEEAAAASALKQVSYAPLELAGSALRDGTFDVGIVEDLAAAPEGPKQLLTPLGRALSRRGLALVGSRNPDVAERLLAPAVEAATPLGYYDFYETVSQHFAEVRMLGQTPFVGYAIADFSAADPSDVRLDTALVPGGAEEPEWFLALASALPVSPDAFAVIQLPLAELELGGGRPAESGTTAPSERAEARLRELEAALEKATAERARDAEKHAAERARDSEKFASERARDAEKHAAERARDAEKHAAERSREAADRSREAAERSREDEKLAAQRTRDAEKRDQDKQLAQKLQRLEGELRKREEWARGLEQRAEAADQRADDAQGELEQASAEQRRLKSDIGRLEAQLEEERRARHKLDEGSRGQRQDLEQKERRMQTELQRVQTDAKRAEAELQRVQSDAKRAEAELQRAQQELSRAQADTQRGQAEQASKHEALTARVAQLTSALAESEKKLKQLAESGDEEARAELVALEAMLKDRAAEVARLTAALHETERFGRQLIVDLSEARAARDAAREDGPDVQALTRQNAQLAADLEAARWTISSLEANVAAGPTAGPGASAPRRDDLPPVEPHTVPSAD